MDAQEFLDLQKKQPYEYEPHSFKKTKRLPWLVCNKCGLVTINNKFTEWGIQMGCNQQDHPQYAAKRLKFTEL